MSSKSGFEGSSQSKWLGRKKKGEQDNNSFASFVRAARATKAGKAHLEKHHKGYGIKNG